MDVAHPGTPANIPADFAKPSSRYRSRAWLALAGLIGFLGIYLGMAGWLAWTCYRLMAAAGNSSDAGNVFIGLGAGFLSLFLFKALFFLQRGKPSDDFEVKASEQPALFAFIYALAKEIKSPRPFRVYLSPRVNACVFYDLSLLNFIIPSRKNLEIGLGLVNVLNVGELKAVLAHEFGHFAQRSMAVGRWVYISQQIAAHIVAKRDGFDNFLAGLSRVDVRIAWIGWLFSLIIWSIRSIVEVLFMAVMLAEKALSREMEFHADLVSVSVSGSDALINALHKLGAADDAWARAISFANEEKAAGRCTHDVFPLQSRVLERMRNLLNDPHYGIAPVCTTGERHAFRVFKTSLAAPPQMWSTHPSNADREENAKRRYLAASIDERSAWDLFDHRDSIRQSVSQRVLGAVDGPTLAPEELLERLDQQYRMTYLDAAFRGVYFGRSTVRHARSLAELYTNEPADPYAVVGTLYPSSLSPDVEGRRALEEESALLKGLASGSLRKSGDAIRYRGREVSNRELPSLTAKVDTELAVLNDRIREHDKLCRSTHVALARSVGQGWDGYLRGLLAVHHYASHAEAVLRDANLHYQQTLRKELSKRASQKPDLDIILSAAKVVYRSLSRTHAEASSLSLDVTLLARLSAPTWTGRMQDLKLAEPSKETLGNWVKVADSWIEAAVGNLASLRFISLEQLLELEQLIAKTAQERQSLPDAAAPSVVPNDYPRLMLGEEISNTKPGWRARYFGSGGVIPLMMRLSVAAAIIGIAIWSAWGAGHASVTIYNGLGRPVQVSIGKISTTIGPFGHQRIEITDDEHVHVRATTTDGREIDNFDATVTGRGAHDVYNVARAGVLVAWTAVYGNVAKVPPRPLGAPHWINSAADVEFAEPPASISTKGGGGTRSVITGLSGESPEEVLGALENNRAEMVRVIKLHANWDSPSATYSEQWAQLVQRVNSST
jgi:Zn-dependent protease with chaperone function